MKLLYRGYGNYKRNIVTLTSLGLLGGFFEAIGITAFIPAFTFLTGGGSANDPISSFLKTIFDFFHITFSFRYLVIFAVVLFFCRTAVLLIGNYVRIKIVTDYEIQTKNLPFRKTVQASWPYLLNEKIGHLQTVLVTHVDYCRRLLDTLSSTIIVVTGIIVYLLAAFAISPFVSGITLVAALALSAFIQPLAKYVRRLAGDLEVVSKRIAHIVNENVSGMKIIKAMRVEREIALSMQESFADYRGVRLKITFLGLIPGSLMQPLSLLFVVFLFAIFYTSNAFNLAAFGATVYLIQKIFMYAQQAQGQVLSISESLPFLKKTIEYEEEVSEHREENKGKDVFSLKKQIRFDEVTFSYPGRPAVLSGISFTLKRGEVVGLVGPSGAGKTTISDLLLRLFNPTGGSILLDDTPIHAVTLDAWRKNIGYVPQDIFLINDTIANNIRFYNAALSEEEVSAAARMAYVYEFADALPEGLETIVGEKGVMLSVGQRQRIVIARALVRKPQLLILDEATSALDNASEAVIQKIIEGLKGTVTTLVIAHRLSTVSKADRVLVLMHGAIVEDGRPEDLLNDSASHFFTMHHAAS